MTCGCEQVRVYRFLGLDWLGLPFPVRFAAWLVYLYRGGSDHFTEFQAKRWVGCGCIKVLREAFA